MSWSDDEKRAALGLLARIAESLDALTAATERATSPETLQASMDAAQRAFDRRGTFEQEPAAVLSIARDDRDGDLG